MLPSTAASHHEQRRYLEQQYEVGLENSTIVPFVYPAASFAAALVLIFLLIPPRESIWLKYGRYFVFYTVCGSSTYSICYCRSPNLATSFGIGLISSWGVLWSATLLIFNDAKTNFKRLERNEGRPYHVSFKPQEDSDHKLIPNRFSGENKDNNLAALRKRADMPAASNNSQKAVQIGTVGPTGRHDIFTWQPYPTSPFIQRLDWVLDVSCNFRGVGWNWRIPNLPSFPPWVQAQLEGPATNPESMQDVPVSRTGVQRFDTNKSVILHNIWLIAKGYLAIDVLKTISNHDPYFWGLTDSLPPSYYPESLRTNGPLLRIYRLLVVMTAIWMTLRTIFAMAAPFFVGILGAKRIGSRGEPWFYPDAFGNYSVVFDNGLAAWWSSWWHQTFRYAFESGGRWVTSKLNVDAKSLGGKTLRLFTAFALSGFLHASGSMTQVGDTQPLKGPFLFFILQPFGILAQMYASSLLKAHAISTRMPREIRQATNFVFVHVWFYYTAPLLTDDWAKGGIYMFEPLAFSLLRGMGFGAPNDGFWCWGGTWLRLHRGQHWWSSGLAL